MDNKFDIILTKTIKVLTVTILCIMLIIGSLFVFPPSYALSSEEFEIQYSSTNVNTSSYVEGISYYKLNKSSNSYGQIYCITENADPSYYFLFDNGYGQYNYCLTFASGSNIGTIKLSNAIGNEYTFYSTSTYSYNQLYDLKYTTALTQNAYSVTNLYCPVYESLDAGFAALDNYLNSGTFASFPQVSSSTDIDYATIAAQGAFVYAGINTYSFLGQYESSSSPVSQYCYVQTGENAYTAVVFSSVPLTVYKAFINGQTYSYSVCEQYDEGKYCYSFNQFSTLDDVSPLVPFASLTDAKNAFTGASSGSGSASGVVSAGALTYQVPAGNVLYVRVRPGSIASVTADMPVISNTTSPYWLESQINTMWASGVAGLPSSNTVFPLSNMTRINFGLNPSIGTDGYGRSFAAYASHAPFNGGWFVVYNPAYTKAIIPGRTDLMTINPTVTVKCQFALEYYMYPLSETLTVDDGTSSNSTGYTDSWSGQYDPDNDSFEDTSTITDETPTSGGEQAPTINQNNMDIGGYVREIKKTLDEFVETLSQLLTAPIAHIQKLITYASNFMASIAQFFTWLPEPVYTVIVGALVVAVVIGILKLLF